MKKLRPFFVLLFLISNGLTTRAQIIKSVGLRIGVSTNFPEIVENEFRYKGRDDKMNHNSLYPEIQLELFSLNHFSLLANTSYISKGFDYTGSPGGGFGFLGSSDYREKAFANYLTFTIAPKFRYDIKGISVFGFAGVYKCYLKSNDEYYNRLKFNSSNTAYNYSEVTVLKSSNIGGTAGLGLEYKLTKIPILYSAQIQYLEDFDASVNFKNEFDPYGKPSDYAFKMKNKTILIGFGIHYLFSNKE